MNEPSTRWLRGLCAILALVLLIVAAGGGLAVIGLRLQEARQAHSQLRSLTTDVAQAEEPDMLKMRVGTKFALMVERQIVWVRPETAPLREVRPDAAPVQRFPFRVALIQPTMLLAQTP
jgi:hypothetical protein